MTPRAWRIGCGGAGAVAVRRLRRLLLGSLAVCGSVLPSLWGSVASAAAESACPPATEELGNFIREYKLRLIAGASGCVAVPVNMAITGARLEPDWRLGPEFANLGLEVRWGDPGFDEALDRYNDEQQEFLLSPAEVGSLRLDMEVPITDGVANIGRDFFSTKVGDDEEVTIRNLERPVAKAVNAHLQVIETSGSGSVEWLHTEITFRYGAVEVPLHLSVDHVRSLDSDGTELRRLQTTFEIPAEFVPPLGSVIEYLPSVEERINKVALGGSHRVDINQRLNADFGYWVFQEFGDGDFVFENRISFYANKIANPVDGTERVIYVPISSSSHDFSDIRESIDNDPRIRHSVFIFLDDEAEIRIGHIEIEKEKVNMLHRKAVPPLENHAGLYVGFGEIGDLVFVRKMRFDKVDPDWDWKPDGSEGPHPVEYSWSFSCPPQACVPDVADETSFRGYIADSLGRRMLAAIAGEVLGEKDRQDALVLLDATPGLSDVLLARRDENHSWMAAADESGDGITVADVDSIVKSFNAIDQEMIRDEVPGLWLNLRLRAFADDNYPPRDTWKALERAANERILTREDEAGQGALARDAVLSLFLDARANGGLKEDAYEQLVRGENLLPPCSRLRFWRGVRTAGISSPHSEVAKGRDRGRQCTVRTTGISSPHSELIEESSSHLLVEAAQASVPWSNLIWTRIDDARWRECDAESWWEAKSESRDPVLAHMRERDDLEKFAKEEWLLVGQPVNLFRLKWAPSQWKTLEHLLGADVLFAQGLVAAGLKNEAAIWIRSSDGHLSRRVPHNHEAHFGPASGVWRDSGMNAGVWPPGWTVSRDVSFAAALAQVGAFEEARDIAESISDAPRWERAYALARVGGSMARDQSSGRRNRRDFIGEARDIAGGLDYPGDGVAGLLAIVQAMLESVEDEGGVWMSAEELDRAREILKNVKEKKLTDEIWHPGRRLLYESMSVMLDAKIDSVDEGKIYQDRGDAEEIKELSAKFIRLAREGVEARRLSICDLLVDRGWCFFADGKPCDLSQLGCPIYHKSDRSDDYGKKGDIFGNELDHDISWNLTMMSELEALFIAFYLIEAAHSTKAMRESASELGYRLLNYLHSLIVAGEDFIGGKFESALIAQIARADSLFADPSTDDFRLSHREGKFVAFYETARALTCERKRVSSDKDIECNRSRRDAIQSLAPFLRGSVETPDALQLFRPGRSRIEIGGDVAAVARKWEEGVGRRELHVELDEIVADAFAEGDGAWIGIDDGRGRSFRYLEGGALLRRVESLYALASEMASVAYPLEFREALAKAVRRGRAAHRIETISGNLPIQGGYMNVGCS